MKSVSVGDVSRLRNVQVTVSPASSRTVAARAAVSAALLASSQVTSASV